VMMTLSLACLSHSCASSGANAKQLETEAVNGYSTLVCGTRSSIRKAPRRPRRQQHIVQYGKTEPAGQVSGGQKKLLSWMDGARTAQHSTGHLSPRTPRGQSYCTVPTERVLGQSAATPVWVCVCGTAVLVRICPNPHNTPLSCSNSRAC
jgi:hypothetical protein